MTEIQFFDEDEDGESTRVQDMDGRPSVSAFDGQHPRTEPRTLVPGAEMPSKMDEVEELAERMKCTVEELPEVLMAAKQKLDDYARQVQRFSEAFKTKPVSRRMRRAQRFGHHRLHG